jgi:hypothetical protein
MASQVFPAPTLSYAGMVDLYFTSSCTLFNPSAPSKYTEQQKASAQRYFEEVILPDEKRFWDRTGERNVDGSVGWEEGGTGVLGTERKVIVDARIVIDVSEEVKRKWEVYDTGVQI